ncbi:Uncharacterized protein SCF082_LOCUS30455 [Durusdinium trenchii]|uniref:Uncharacterized protein n=1 Tax=Durusdinium trenchii TaxID=1381693 RepID=A0ABP0MZA7_9DINO
MCPGLSFGPTILIREDNMALLAYHDFRVQGDQMLFTRLALLTTMLTSTKVSDGVSKLIVKSDFDKMTRSLHKQTVQMEAILKEAWKQDDTDVGPQKKAMAFGKLSVRMCLLLFGKQKFGRDPLVETFEEITQLYAEELVGQRFHAFGRQKSTVRPALQGLTLEGVSLQPIDQDAVCSIFENYSASASEFCDFDFVLARGRRFPQLVARLGEISDYVTKLGAAGPYSHFYHGHEVPLNNSVLPQLQPYMPLDANRLSIKGHGCFDATPHLGDELLMAYRMPDLLLCDRQPQYGDFPIMTDDATQIIQLAKMWDARGLLFLRRGPVEAESLTRMFNNFKNEECDRQIGDRRGRNYQEAKVYGPSRHVPAGSDLTDLHLDGRKEALYIYCTDRSDFYHQFAVADAKAAANAVGPPVTAADVADLHAYSEMLSREANEKKVKRTREVEGDQLHLLHEPSDKKHPSALRPSTSGHQTFTKQSLPDALELGFVALKPRVSDGIAELVLQAADNPFTEEGVTQMTDYEEALQDMMENGGFANPAVSQICAGLITLYDAKAATTEDAQYYDRATEYISMMQQAMQAAMGDAALTDPTFFYLESRKQKLRRKKDRRLAKGAPSQELQTLMKQR